MLENEHACNLATGEEAAWLLGQIESNAFGLTWDPGNEAVLGFNAFPEGYQHVRGPRILHMHIKDVNRHLESARKEERFVKLGTGCIDYVAQFRALAADGYDGMLSLETHYNHPQGGREPASREEFARSRQFIEMQIQTELAERMYRDWLADLRREASGKVALAPAGN